MKHLLRAAAVAGTMALAAPLTASTATPMASPTYVQKLPGCTGGQLDVELGRLSAAAGSRYQTIRFTNTSSQRCRLDGHPKVSFRGKQHRRIGWPAKWVGGTGEAFVLRTGRTAKTAVQIPDWRNFPVKDCQAKGSPRLRVVPPGTHRKAGFAYPARTCTTKQGRSLVRPVHQAG